MPNRQIRLIQAEFFPPQKSSLVATLSDVEERAKEAQRPKLVVRFYDRTDSVVRLVREMERLEGEYQKRLKAHTSARGWDRTRLSGRVSLILHQKAPLKRRLITMTSSVLTLELNGYRPVAVEDSSRGPFRLVERNERHELLERARRASNVWLWVWPEMDILNESPGKCLHASL